MRIRLTELTHVVSWSDPREWKYVRELATPFPHSGDIKIANQVNHK